MGHRVTLDAFSGSPNPQWQLSDEESKIFDGIVAGLERRDEPGHQPPGLGYRGFKVENNSQREVTVVFLSAISRHTESGSAELQDPEHRLEDLLIASLRGAWSDDSRLAAVLKDIESKQVDQESDT